MEILILYGGRSPEHNVSLHSAFSILENIDFSKYTITPVYITENGEWLSKGSINSPFFSVNDMITDEKPFQLNNISNFDVVFPILMGCDGEDGTIQGLLEIMRVPYIGNGVAASAICIDKVLMKAVFSSFDLPQVNYLWWSRNDWPSKTKEICNEIENKIKFPCYVKSSNLGSSIGVFKCYSKEDLMRAMKKAFSYSSKVLVEESVLAREIEISALGNQNFRFSLAGEINVGEGVFYDYEKKYNEGQNVIVPAQIDSHVYEEMKKIAEKCSSAVGNEGLFRADFFLTKEGHIYINELNTFPGFTETSMYPLLWEKTGVGYLELIDTLIDLAIEKNEINKKPVKS